MDLSNEQVVLITGCTEGGIGNCLARAFASEKCLVVATSRSLSSMRNLQSEDQNRFYLQELDVLSEESVNGVVNNVIEKFGKIDILVNNAGIHCVGPLAEIPLSDVQNAFNTNVYGPLRLIQAVVPHMVGRRKGKIVNVGSIAPMLSGPWAGAYAATKAALHALSDTLRLEVAMFGIDVITVAPGGIRSNIGTASIASLTRMPEWKFYNSFEGSIRARARFSQSPHSTLGEEFANKTVAAVLKKNPPAWFSYGYCSKIAAIMYHLPFWLRDFLFTRPVKASNLL